MILIFSKYIVSNTSRIKVKIILQNAEFPFVTVILLIKKKTNISVLMRYAKKICLNLRNAMLSMTMNRERTYSENITRKYVRFFAKVSPVII